MQDHHPPRLWSGTLVEIFMAETAGVEMNGLSEAELVAGSGLVGDRYATKRGHYSQWHHQDRQLTLIESEVLSDIERDYGIELSGRETRRNMVTAGVPLNHLVGKMFMVGDVVLFGGRLNVPCKYLERLIDKPVFGPLVHRSGLNCQVLTSGTVHVNDVISPFDRHKHDDPSLVPA